MGKDRRGVDRGKCTKCPTCSEFEPSYDHARCDYCDCVPAKHIQRSAQTSEGQGHGEDITQARGIEYLNRAPPDQHQWYEWQTEVVHESMQPSLHQVYSTPHTRNGEYHDGKQFNIPQQFQRGVSHQPMYVGISPIPRPDPRYGPGFYPPPSRIADHGRPNLASDSIDHHNAVSPPIAGVSVEADVEHLRKLQDENAYLKALLKARQSESHTMPVAGNETRLGTSASMSVSHSDKSVQPIPGWRQPVKVTTGGSVELQKNQASAELDPLPEQNPLDQEVGTSEGKEDDSNLEYSPEANLEQSPTHPKMATIDIPTGPKHSETGSAANSPVSTSSIAKILEERSTVVKDHMNDLSEEMKDVRLQDSGSKGTSSVNNSSSESCDLEFSDSKAEMEEEQMNTVQTLKFRKAPSKEREGGEGQSSSTIGLHTLNTGKREKDTQEHLTANTQADNSQSDYQSEQNHTFNPRCHGKNIQIEDNGISARSNHTFTDGICFSNMLIKVGERIHLKIIESKKFKGSMKIGFTSNNPNQIDVESLPAHSYPDLAQTPGFWIKPLHDKLAQQGNVITYMVDSSGDVFYSINGEDKGLFFSGVDVSGCLWAVLDIHGSTIAVQFSNEQAVTDAADKTIHEGDLVKLEVDSVETLTLLQDGHGEMQGMEKAIGDTGEVVRIDEDKDVRVNFINHRKMWCINPAALKKVPGAHSTDMIRERDFVMIKTDIAEIQALQEGHGEWVDTMQQTLGRIGRVRRVTQGGTIRVRVAGIPKTWTFNDKAVRKINMQQHKTEKTGVCEKGLHYWKKGVAKVCKNCCECTSKGRECALQGSPLRTPGSPCGCRDKDAGCADCELCRSCAGESDDDSDSDKNREKVLRTLLKKYHGEEEEEEDEKVEVALGISKGDVVKVDIDPPTFRVLQEQSGLGWNEDMLEVIGTEGTVTGLMGSCVTVKFPTGASWALVRSCLTKVKRRERVQGDRKWMKAGELVRVEGKKRKLKELQHQKYGSYAHDMDSCIGKTGCVLKVSGDVVKVDVSGRTWAFHPEALYPAVLEDREDLQFTDQLKEGDYVKVDVDAETLKSEQSGHGGFADNMCQLEGKVGVVHHIDIDGDAVVYYPDGTSRADFRSSRADRECGSR